MTHAPAHAVTRAGAILSRLLIVLALVLFGVPQNRADDVVNAGPAAQSKVEQADAILTAQRNLLRAQLPGDSAQDMATPGALVQAQPPLNTATMAPAPHLTVLPTTMRILPPVRAPPAA